MANYIKSPVEPLGSYDDLTGTGGETNPFVPDAPAPIGGTIPFKGIEPIKEANTSGISIAGPKVEKPGA